MNYSTVTNQYDAQTLVGVYVCVYALNKRMVILALLSGSKFHFQK